MPQAWSCAPHSITRRAPTTVSIWRLTSACHRRATTLWLPPVRSTWAVPWPLPTISKQTAPSVCAYMRKKFACRRATSVLPRMRASSMARVCTTPTRTASKRVEGVMPRATQRCALFTAGAMLPPWTTRLQSANTTACASTRRSRHRRVRLAHFRHHRRLQQWLRRRRRRLCLHCHRCRSRHLRHRRRSRLRLHRSRLRPR